ncbi:hypothetical protein TNCV_2699771 [Trichonephila clavipes]|nr:hypothetical protein TNCV_2699771 [Trichonephila clavipes]
MYSHDILLRKQAFEWHRSFKAGKVSKTTNALDVHRLPTSLKTLKSFCGGTIFSELARRFQGRRFQFAGEIKSASQTELKDMAKKGFEKCFDDLFKGWQKCAVAQRSYFKGGCVSERFNWDINNLRPPFPQRAEVKLSRVDRAAAIKKLGSTALESILSLFLPKQDVQPYERYRAATAARLLRSTDVHRVTPSRPFFLFVADYAFGPISIFYDIEVEEQRLPKGL